MLFSPCTMYKKSIVQEVQLYARYQKSFISIDPLLAVCSVVRHRCFYQSSPGLAAHHTSNLLFYPGRAAARQKVGHSIRCRVSDVYKRQVLHAARKIFQESSLVEEMTDRSV